ncbi:MAG: endonuclease [Myxococcales bacterium]
MTLTKSSLARPFLLALTVFIAACGNDPTGKADGSLPQADAELAELDASAPGVDADLAAPDAELAAPDAESPGAPDASLESPDAALPPDAETPIAPDATLPEPPDAAAGLDASAPGLDAAAPGPDASAPGLDAAAPGPDASAPGLDAARPPGPDAGAPGLDAATPPGPDASAPGLDAATPPDAAAPLPDAATPPDASEPGPDAGPQVATLVRVMAANLTSGNGQDYDPGHGLRLMQGMHPDIVVIQEFSYGDDSDAAMQEMVDQVGAGFAWCREYASPPPAGSIPNGIISRWPILECGHWEDTRSPNREFAYARIDLPGPVDLWAVSVHLLTADATTRNNEAVQLLTYLNANIPAGDYVVLGGDFNTVSWNENAFDTLSVFFDVAEPHPADQNGNPYTNTGRTKSYDQLLANPRLHLLQVPTDIGSRTFPSGLVLDSRIYTPLSEISPVKKGDSGAYTGSSSDPDVATNMQHMGVVKDFLIP